MGDQQSKGVRESDIRNLSNVPQRERGFGGGDDYDNVYRTEDRDQYPDDRDPSGHDHDPQATPENQIHSDAQAFGPTRTREDVSEPDSSDQAASPRESQQRVGGSAIPINASRTNRSPSPQPEPVRRVSPMPQGQGAGMAPFADPNSDGEYRRKEEENRLRAQLRRSGGANSSAGRSSDSDRNTGRRRPEDQFEPPSLNNQQQQQQQQQQPRPQQRAASRSPAMNGRRVSPSPARPASANRSRSLSRERAAAGHHHHHQVKKPVPDTSDSDAPFDTAAERKKERDRRRSRSNSRTRGDRAAYRTQSLEREVPRAASREREIRASSREREMEHQRGRDRRSQSPYRGERPMERGLSARSLEDPHRRERDREVRRSTANGPFNISPRAEEQLLLQQEQILQQQFQQHIFAQQAQQQAQQMQQQQQQPSGRVTPTRGGGASRIKISWGPGGQRMLAAVEDPSSEPFSAPVHNQPPARSLTGLSGANGRSNHSIREYEGRAASRDDLMTDREQLQYNTRPTPTGVTPKGPKNSLSQDSMISDTEQSNTADSEAAMKVSVHPPSGTPQKTNAASSTGSASSLNTPNTNSHNTGSGVSPTPGQPTPTGGIKRNLTIPDLADNAEEVSVVRASTIRSSNQADFESTIRITDREQYSVEDLLRNRPVKGSWIDSKSMTNCTKCKASFGILKKPHHCVFCGLVFCASCSDKKRYYDELPFIKQPMRVCEACFHRGPPDAQAITDVYVQLDNAQAEIKQLQLEIKASQKREARIEELRSARRNLKEQVTALMKDKEQWVQWRELLQEVEDKKDQLAMALEDELRRSEELLFALNEEKRRSRVSKNTLEADLHAMETTNMELQRILHERDRTIQQLLEEKMLLEQDMHDGVTVLPSGVRLDAVRLQEQLLDITRAYDKLRVDFETTSSRANEFKQIYENERMELSDALVAEKRKVAELRHALDEKSKESRRVAKEMNMRLWDLEAQKAGRNDPFQSGQSSSPRTDAEKQNLQAAILTLESKLRESEESSESLRQKVASLKENLKADKALETQLREELEKERKNAAKAKAREKQSRASLDKKSAELLALAMKTAERNRAPTLDDPDRDMRSPREAALKVQIDQLKDDLQKAQLHNQELLKKQDELVHMERSSAERESQLIKELEACQTDLEQLLQEREELLSKDRAGAVVSPSGVDLQKKNRGGNNDDLDGLSDDGEAKRKRGGSNSDDDTGDMPPLNFQFKKPEQKAKAVADLEKSVADLTKQVEESARKETEVRDQLKRCVTDLENSNREKAQLEQAKQAAVARENQLMQSLVTLQSQLKQVESKPAQANADSLQAELTTIRNERNELNRKLQAMELEKLSLEERALVAEEKFHNAESDLHAATDELRKVEEELKSFETTVTDAHTAMTFKDQELAAIEQDLKKAVEALSEANNHSYEQKEEADRVIAELRANMQQLQIKADALERQYAEVSKDYSSVQLQTRTFTIEKEGLNRTIEQLTAKESEAREQLKRCVTDLEKAQNELKLAQAARDEALAREKSTMQTLVGMQAKLADSEQRSKSVGDREAQLQDAVKRLEVEKTELNLKLNERSAAQSQREQELEAVLGAITGENEQFKASAQQKQQRLQQELEELAASLSDATVKLSNLQDQHQAAREREQQLQEQLQQVSAEKAQLATKFQELTSSFAALQAEKTQIAINLKALESANAQLSSEVGSDSRLQEAISKAAHAEGKLAAREKQLETLANELAQLTAQRLEQEEAHQSTLADLTRKHSAELQQLRAQSAVNEHADVEAESLRAKLETASIERLQLSHEKDQIASELRSVLKRESKLQSELSECQRLLESLSGELESLTLDRSELAAKHQEEVYRLSAKHEEVLAKKESEILDALQQAALAKRASGGSSPAEAKVQQQLIDLLSKAGDKEVSSKDALEWPVLVEKLRTRFDLLESRVSRVTANESKMQVAMERNQKDLQDNVVTLKRSLSLFSAEMKTKQAELVRIQEGSQETLQQLQKQIESLKEESERLRQRCLALTAELGTLEQQSAEMARLKQLLAETTAQLEQKNQQLAAKQQEWKMEEAKLQQSKEYLQQRSDSMAESLSKMCDQMDALEQRCAELSLELEQCRKDSQAFAADNPHLDRSPVSVSTNTDDLPGLPALYLLSESSLDSPNSGSRMGVSRTQSDGSPSPIPVSPGLSAGPNRRPSTSTVRHHEVKFPIAARLSSARSGHQRQLSSSSSTASVASQSTVSGVSPRPSDHQHTASSASLPARPAWNKYS